MLPQQKLSVLKKRTKTSPKPAVNILTEGCNASLVSSRGESPSAGRATRNGLGECRTPALVLLNQKAFSFLVFSLITGAAGQFSRKTEIAFLDVFVGMQWKSPGCWRHLQWL